MARSTQILISLSFCLALVACNSGPSSSGPAAPGADEAAVLGRKADLLGGLLGRRHAAAQLFDDLISALPDRAWLTEVVYDESGVQVKGRAPTNNLLSDYLSRLEGSSLLADAILRGSTMKTARGREWVEFFLQAAVRDPGPAPAPAGASPAARLDELEKAFAPR
jgi:Tfp pilus assembly protein PilN